MSFNRLILAITFLAIFAMGLRFSVDTDTWWQLRTGELIAEDRAIPKTDTFSFTREGETWRYPSSAWLIELKLFLIHDWFGTGGLNIWMAGMITLAFAFIYMAMSGGGFLRAFVLILATAVSGVYWAARPYMASFVLSAVFLWILEDYRWGRKNRVIWLPILMILWVNSHPGFAVGFILVGIYFLDEIICWFGENWPIKRKNVQAALRGKVGVYLLVILGMLVGACLSPAGISVFSYPFETVSIGVLRDYIQEWQSPNFHELAAQPFIWLLLLTLLAIGLSRTQLAVSDFLLIAISAYMTLLAGRNMPLFALVAPIVLTRNAVLAIDKARKWLNLKKTTARKVPGWQGLLNVSILAVLALAVTVRALSMYPDEANQASYADDAPVAAVDYLKAERPTGRLFNSYNWGGYLIWNLRDYPVFVDGRTDLYSQELLTEWLNTVNGIEGWQDTLEKWEIGLVLIEPNWPLAKLLPTEGWQMLFEDDHSVLYGR
jgi:hypothetical protein